MTSVYKFDNYSTYKISSSVLYDTGTVNGPIRKLEDHFIPYYRQNHYNEIAVPILKKIDIISNKDCPYTGKIDIEHLLNTVDNFTFEILCICQKEELNDLEKFYIEKYNSVVPNGYNMTSGGENP